MKNEAYNDHQFEVICDDGTVDPKLVEAFQEILNYQWEQVKKNIQEEVDQCMDESYITGAPCPYIDNSDSEPMGLVVKNESQ